MQRCPPVHATQAPPPSPAAATTTPSHATAAINTANFRTRCCRETRALAESSLSAAFKGHLRNSNALILGCSLCASV